MPMIKVEMFPGRTLDQKRKFAKVVTDSFVEICGGTPQSVHVVFADVPASEWAVAGELCSERKPAAPAKTD
jgi:4-oxalocrotonate tautomerase